MSEVRVGALAAPYAKAVTANFLEQDIFVSHVQLNGRRLFHVPRRRILRSETRAQLTQLGIEIVG